MAKRISHVYRKDALEDHAHATPDGRVTGGALYKPSTSLRAGYHTHLYEYEGKTLETAPAYEGGDHVHETELGDTSGPQSLAKPVTADFARQDSADVSAYVQRRGREWYVVSPGGKALGKHPTQSSAANHLAEIERARQPSKTQAG